MKKVFSISLAILMIFAFSLTAMCLPGENIARQSTVTTSSDYSESYSNIAAIDGAGGVLGTGEWASLGEIDPWINFEFPSEVSVNRLVISDRPGEADNSEAGTITFSDGSTLNFTDLPYNGTPLDLKFDAKKIKSLKIQITGEASSPNNGLAEVEIYDSSTESNIAGDSTVTTSSDYSEDYSAAKAIDKKVSVGTGEWASLGEIDPWVDFKFASEKWIDKIVIYDRAGDQDNSEAGAITFSDGSTVNFADLPYDGTPLEVKFDAKKVVSFKIQIAGEPASPNNGLTEVEIYEAADPTPAEAAPVEAAPVVDEPVVEAPAPVTAPKTGDNGINAIIFISLALSAVGFVCINKKNQSAK